MTEPELLRLLAKARDRADQILGGVAASTRERVAQEFVSWWVQGREAAH